MATASTRASIASRGWNRTVRSIADFWQCRIGNPTMSDVELLYWLQQQTATERLQVDTSSTLDLLVISRAITSRHLSRPLQVFFSLWLMLPPTFQLLHLILRYWLWSMVCIAIHVHVPLMARMAVPLVCIQLLFRCWTKLLKSIRYDTRCYFNVRSKADISQLNLPHGNRQVKKCKNRKKLKSKKMDMLRSSSKQSGKSI